MSTRTSSRNRDRPARPRARWTRAHRPALAAVALLVAVIGLPAATSAPASGAPTPAKATVGSILYSACDFNGSGTVFQIAPDGATAAKALLKGANPRVSPNGARIAVNRGVSTVVTSGLDGANQHSWSAADHGGNAGQTAWSPDGSRLAFPEPLDLVPGQTTGTFDQGSVATVTDTAASTPTNSDLAGSDGSLDWSKNDTWLVGHRFRETDGSFDSAIAQGPAFTNAPADLAEPTPPPAFSKWFSPRYRPDGTPAWAGVKNDGAGHSENGLFVDGTFWLNLPNIDSFAFSPDGLWVVASISIQGGNRIDVYKFDGSFGYTLVPNAQTVCGVDWAPGATPPSASFTVAAGSKTPGVFQLVSTSTNAGGGALDQQWTISNGQTAVGPSMVATFTKPGTYTATLKVTNAAGQSATASQPIVVAAPKLSVAVTVPAGTTVVPGATVTAHIQVSASADGVGSLSALKFDSNALLTAAPAKSADVSKVPAAPGPFVLAPGANKAFDAKVKVTAPGHVVLSSGVGGTDAAGAAVHDTGSVTVSASVLKVTVTANPATVEQNGDADKVTPVDITVTATVTNIGGAPIDDVTVDVRPTLRAAPGTTSPVPFPLRATGDASPSRLIGALAAGAKRSVTYPLVADASIDAQIQVLALGSAAGVTVRGLGTGSVSVTPKFPIVVTAQRTDEDDIVAGQAAVVTGTVKNRSNTKTFMVYEIAPQTPKGFILRDLRPLTTPFAASPADPEGCICDSFVRLKPGQSWAFHARLQVQPIPPDSDPYDGLVSFKDGVKADEITTVDGVEVRTPLAAEKIFVSPGSRTIFLHVVAPERAVPDDQELFNGFVAGFWDKAYVTDLIKGVNDGVQSLGAALYAVEQFRQEWDTLSAAEQHQYIHDAATALAKKIEGVASVDTVVKIANAMQDGRNALETWWRTADAGTRGYAIGGMTKTVVGDLTLGLVTDALACKVMSGRRGIDGVRLAEEALAKDAEEIAKGGMRVDKGLAGLPSGVEATEEIVAARMGIVPQELRAAEAVAADEGVMLLIRSRAAASPELLAANEAIAKMFAMKAKGVTPLDRFLFQITDSNVLPDAVTAIQDGSPFKSAEEVIAAAKLQGFSDVVQQAAVRRWETREHEWAKYGKQLMQWADEGSLPIEFPTAQNTSSLLTNGEPLAYKRVPFRMDTVRVADGVTTYVPKVEIEIKNAAGQVIERRWVPIVGDIDIVGILEADGTTVTSGQKLLRVMDKLRLSALDTQHPGTLTWLNDPASIDLLGDHVLGKAGAEPMLAVGPIGKPRLAFFDPKRSLGVDNRLKNGVKLIFLEGAPRTPAPVRAVATAIPPLIVNVNRGAQYFPPEGWNPGDFKSKLVVDRKSGRVVRQVSLDKYQQFSAQDGWTPLPPTPAPGTKAKLFSTDGGVFGSSIPAFASAQASTASLPGDLAPQTATTVASPVGATAVTALTAGDVLPGTTAANWFRPGDLVVLDPGGPNQETATIATVGAKLTFTKPLAHKHAAGDLVGLLTAAPDPQPTGSTTTTTVPATTSTVTVAAAGGSTSSTAPAVATGSSNLPRTGAGTGWLAAVGVAFVLAGSATAGVVGRRRDRRRR